MKKILLITIALALFYLPKNVSAKQEQVYEAEKINNMWIKKVKNNKTEYHQASVIRRKSDNNYVYCIEPWSTISENSVYNDITNVNDISDSTIRKIATASYYGFEYFNHTNIKWYYITQVAIWKIIDPEADFYFTDTLNGNKINTYDEQILEILNLVDFNSKIPDYGITEITIPIGGIIEILDKNKIQNYFHIKQDGKSILSEAINNSLQITGKELGETELTFTQKTNRFKEDALIYRHENTQNFLSAGNIAPLTTKIKVNVVEGKIIINKLDADTNSTIPSGEASLKESRFELYDESMHLLEEKTTIDNQLEFNKLPVGKYYLKETSAGTGYTINNEIKEINITTEEYEITVNFYNKVIESEIIIQKYYGKNDIWKNEENAIFEIYNNKNKLIKTVTTNKKGIARVTLPYGVYTLKQISGKENYELSKPFTVKIEKNNQNIKIIKHNNEITGKLTILKIDSKTNLPLKNNPAFFKLYDYKQNKWLDKEYKTNENGILIIDNLSIGKYKIIEIEAPNGYENKYDEYQFEITKENLNINLEIPNETIYEIPNTSIQLKLITIEEIIYDYKKKYFFTNNNINT
ncbi:MAG: Cys-Gln thioester bond-forming surface protein [Bacilli bacterium]|nr:Cys-Gln thioester bond-forming surface protein [Bacilli bacterium]